MNLHCKPIGIIYSPFKTQEGTPIQPEFSDGTTATIEIFKEFRDGLADLEGYERIWLLFWLHMSCEPKMKVVPYRDTVPRGLFSTRAPSRPNPIGLSCVKLEKIEGLFLHITGCDILDETPLLDIKPYSAKIDSYPDARGGWFDQSEKHDKADGRFSRQADNRL